MMIAGDGRLANSGAQSDEVAMREWWQRSAHGPNHKWWALVTVAIGTFMATLDSSIVNISLPAILSHFRSDLATIQWVVLAYLLTITSLLLTFGRLSDIWGRKKVYTIGFGIFTIGSLACGLAPSPAYLIAARVVQAVGAAMTQANGLAITNAVFPGKERGRALGINGTVVATGTTLGPALGGVLVGAFGWQSIFFVNLPVGLLGIVLALAILEEERISTRREGAAAKFDPLGAILVSVGLVTLLLALNRGDQVGWLSAQIIGLFAVAAVSLAAFIYVERRVVAPILDLALFRVRAFATGSLAALCSFLAISANAFLMPFFLQLVLGFSPARAGLLLTPTSLTLAIVAPLSGWLSDRFGARILSSVGLGISAVALLFLSQLTAQAHYADVLLRLILLGVGIGIFNSPNTAAVFSSVPRDRYGVAGGFLSMVRNTGQVVGVAIAGALLIAAIAPVVGNAGLDGLRTGAEGGGANGPLLGAFMEGFRHAFIFSAVLAAFGAVISLLRGQPPAADSPAPVAAETD
jgi:EmrB/QacA subfamily drug resistance transporter